MPPLGAGSLGSMPLAMTNGGPMMMPGSSEWTRSCSIVSSGGNPVLVAVCWENIPWLEVRQLYRMFLLIKLNSFLARSAEMYGNLTNEALHMARYRLMHG